MSHILSDYESWRSVPSTEEYPLRIERATFVCADKVELAGTIVASSNGKIRRSLVIAPALGIRMNFYIPFAKFMADHGTACFVFDYRGVGDSQQSNDKMHLIDMERWGTEDIDAAIRFTLAAFPNLPCYHIGHSCGAQLVGLAASSLDLAGMIFVAPSLPNVNWWQGLERHWYKFLFKFVMRYITDSKGMFPAKRLRFGSANVPSSVVRQWAKWMCADGYFFNAALGIKGTTRYKRLTSRALCFSFADDKLVPEGALNAFLAELPRARLSSRRINPSLEKTPAIGHAGFFRERSGAVFWPEVEHWLAATGSRPD